MATQFFRRWRQHSSPLAWPSWLRMLATFPAIGLLWALVLWANRPAAPW